MTALPASCEQRADERTHQYAAFWDYATLGSRRSLALLQDNYRTQYEAHLANPAQQPVPPSRNLNTLKKWSAAFGWVVRVAEYDSYMISLEHEERVLFQRELVRAELSDYAEQLRRWRAAYEHSHCLEIDEETITDETGQTIILRTIQLNVSKMKLFTDWRIQISMAGRLALGMPQKSQNIDHTSDGKSAVQVWEDLMLRPAGDTGKSGWE